MKCLANGEEMFNYKTRLGEYKIGAFLGEFLWENDELFRLIDLCQQIWKEIFVKSGKPNFIGLVRPDLVPGFSNPEGKSLGKLEVRGIYEINVHSPECLAGISALEHFTGLKTENDPCIVFSDKLKEFFGNSQIAFVCGNNLLKREWGAIFFAKLKSLGINVRWISPEESMRESPKIIFRWGDARIDGPSHFSPVFVNWLRTQKKSFVFNSVPNGVDLGDKSFLIKTNDDDLSKIFGINRPLRSEEDIWWSVDENGKHSNFLVKPDKGASGDDIFFGENMISSQWIRILKEKLSSGRKYSLWEAKWLPEVMIGQDSFSMDLDPVFWAEND
ncbi:MAG: hypothetical protein PHX98_01385, partial [Candidatus Moranbacteria bacterium]|nr:hypothetical protein [Candidatus Moranbacteria bacterium]